MAFTYLIVELHCLYGRGEQEQVNPVPPFCKNGFRKPGYHCLAENYEFSGHAPTLLEIAIQMNLLNGLIIVLLFK